MKRCPSYPGYSVTEDGHIFTHRRRFGKGKGHGGGVTIDNDFNKELNPYNGHGGYPYFSIKTKGVQRSIPLHTLLLDAFVGERPEGSETRHLDSNPLNNSLDNLCYGSRKENAGDLMLCDNHSIGIKHGMAILSEADVRNIRSIHALGETIASVARKYQRGETTIREIVKRTHWKHI